MRRRWRSQWRGIRKFIYEYLKDTESGYFSKHIRYTIKCPVIFGRKEKSNYQLPSIEYGKTGIGNVIRKNFSVTNKIIGFLRCKNEGLYY